MKTAVIGGTFDPIHNAHLAIAREAKRRLFLDRVLFVPAGRPWLKGDRKISSAADRVAMVRLAIAGEPSFEASTVETDRRGPSYSVDTMRELRRLADAGDELYLILGWDSVSFLPLWREPSRIIGLCRIVAVPRQGYHPPDAASLNRAIPGLAERLVLLDRPNLDISASDIRRRVARGLPIHDLVPEAVERYIREHGLYTEEEKPVENP